MCVNPTLMDPPGLNPHCGITAIDPPRHGPRPDDEPPRRWKCNSCSAQGTMAELAKIACMHVYPPCKYCGQTPECARYCDGIARALSDPSVYVTAGPPKGAA